MSPNFLKAMRFSTLDLPAAEQFAAYRALMSSIYEVTPLDGVEPEKFAATLSIWTLGNLNLGTQLLDPHDFRRSLRRASSDGFDHYSIILLRKGAIERHAGDPGAPILPGRPTLHDATQPLRVAAVKRNSCITLALPREMLAPLLGRPLELHGRALEGAVGKLFASHLHMLINSLPRLTEAEGVPLARATVEILAACLAPSGEAVERARGPMKMALLRQARRAIEPRLQARDLTPDQISRELGVSRSTLYALFEPHGGVAAYIRGRRLARIHALLANPQNRESIRELALRHGFVSEAHFSRAFRETYGYSAREARESFGQLPPNGGRVASGLAESFVDWARTLYA